MMLFIYILSFVFGTVIGSFLNVVICRMHTGMKITGRSVCFSCNKQLSWYELIPVLSFALQRARCRGCQSKISWQYPIVELSTGVLFALSALYAFPVSYLLISQQALIFVLYLWLIMSILVVISVYDIRHKIIPDAYAYSLALITVLFFIFNTGISNIFNSLYIWDLFAGLILAIPFAFLWLVSKGQWMGLGDAKLVLGIGWLLGLYAGISAIIMAFWIGAVVGIVLILLKGKNFNMKTEIPFGPFLVFSTLLVLFFGIDILTLVM